MTHIFVPLSIAIKVDMKCKLTFGPILDKKMLANEFGNCSPNWRTLSFHINSFQTKRNLNYI
jgi:hypothetical protein